MNSFALPQEWPSPVDLQASIILKDNTWRSLNKSRCNSPVYDRISAMPRWAGISAGNGNNVPLNRRLHITPRTIVVTSNREPRRHLVDISYTLLRCYFDIISY